MKRTPVESSNLVSVGYDSDNSMLEIEFDKGTVYQYFGVPISIYEGLMKADSHGKYFIAHIKDGPYKYKRVT